MSKPRTRPARIIRSDGWTLPRQRLFLKMLAVTGSVEKACAEAEMSISSAYRLRLHPEGKAFREAWALARHASVHSLREMALDRALNGSREPIVDNGEIIGHRIVYNDKLLMFLLKRYDNPDFEGTQNRLVGNFQFLEASNDPEPEAVAHPVEAEAETATGFALE